MVKQLLIAAFKTIRKEISMNNGFLNGQAMTLLQQDLREE